MRGFVGVLACAATLCLLWASASAETLPVAPKPIKRTMPEFPSEAWAQKLDGEAKAELSIDDGGSVEAVKIVAETPPGHGFGAATEAALLEWKFPAGKPGRYRVTMKFDYEELPIAKELPGAPPPVKKRQPRYPRDALNAGQEGEVFLIVLIEADGRVGEVRIDGEQPPGFGFGEAAKAAVTHWEFPPGVPAYYTVTVRFRMWGSQDDGVAFVPSQLKEAPAPSWSQPADYPDQARDQGVEGAAIIAVQINKRGQVTHGSLLSEAPTGMGFGESAYRAVVKWRFKDAEPGGYWVRVDFKLNGKKAE